MDRILDYGSNDEGSIPSRGTQTLKQFQMRNSGVRPQCCNVQCNVINPSAPPCPDSSMDRASVFTVSKLVGVLMMITLYL